MTIINIARENIKDTTAEQRHTADCRRAGCVDRGELPSLVEATLERMAELFLGGRFSESRAMHRREFERH
jgi:hypothetical protein